MKLLVLAVLILAMFLTGCTRTCIDGDNICRPGCNYLNDDDCKKLTPGTPANFSNGDVKITVSNPHIEICVEDVEHRYTYLVFDLSIENKGKEPYYSTMDFSAVDPKGKKFEVDNFVYPYPRMRSKNCRNAEHDAFIETRILPASKNNGKVWIKISDNGTYRKGEWFIIYDGHEFTPDAVYEVQIK